MAGKRHKENATGEQSSFVGMERPTALPIENPNLLPNGKRRSKRRANGALPAWHRPYTPKHERVSAVRGWRIFDLIIHDKPTTTLRPPPRDRSITFVSGSSSKDEEPRVFHDYVFPKPGEDVSWDGLRKMAAMARAILKKK